MSEGSSVALSCAAGDAPAGVMLELNGTPAAGARLGLDLLLRGDAGFSARLVTSADGKPSEATALPAGPSSQVRLALPLAGQLALAVSCPNGAGRLEIVRGRVVSAGSALTEPPAAWVWNQHLWQHEAGRVRDWARRWSVATLFISVPVEAGAVRDVARLAEFIREARTHGIAVFAVEGDPDMISGEGRGHALVRARAIADYQAAHPTARLAGLQYDIEPYVAPGFAADAATAWRQWGETLRSLSAVYGAKVDAVVPFWMLESPGGSDALATAAPVLEQLTVMAYRTDTTEITSAAAPLLSWAVEREIPVTIALEAAPLLPDLRETFEPADIGELHAYRIGQFVAFVLLDRPGAADGARVYRRRHVVPTKPERLTFAGHPGRLASTLETLANGLSAWPSARRVALHGLADSELSPAEDQIPMETRK